MNSFPPNWQSTGRQNFPYLRSRRANRWIGLLSMSIWLLMLVSLCRAQSSPAPTKPTSPTPLRQVLIEQLQTTHNKKNWFVPINDAVSGLTPEQARWIPLNAKGASEPDTNHSVGMIANHLLFYNRNALAVFKHEKPEAVPKDNEETFNRFDAASWKKTVEDLDQVMVEMERFLAQADEATVAKLAPTVANISTHNAYHTGQILYIRKLQGSWNPENGVK